MQDAEYFLKQVYVQGTQIAFIYQPSSHVPHSAKFLGWLKGTGSIYGGKKTSPSSFCLPA